MPFFVNDIGSTFQFNGICVTAAGKDTIDFTTPHLQRIIARCSVISDLFIGDVLLTTTRIVQEFDPRGNSEGF